MPARRRAADVDGAAVLVEAYESWLAATGRGSASYVNAAWAFLARFPDPQSFGGAALEDRLRLGGSTAPFLTYLMLHRHLRPGHDYLAAR